MYREEDFLQLSGVQHFCFCRRQWALIHLEQLWSDNLRTVEGEILHERAHDPEFSEKRGGLLTVRGLSIRSAELGVSGACDVVEFVLDEGGVPLPRREGCWLPVPVEYKRGSSKQIDADRLQLCGQGLCLEEMLCCQVPKGYLYYGETRRRDEVLFTEELRKQTKAMLREMHGLYERRHTPKVKPTKSCNACSLKDLCLPKLCTRLSAKDYLNARLEEENR